jgi:hypothetical protein
MSMVQNHWTVHNDISPGDPVSQSRAATVLPHFIGKIIKYQLLGQGWSLSATTGRVWPLLEAWPLGAHSISQPPDQGWLCHCPLPVVGTPAGCRTVQSGASPPLDFANEEWRLAALGEAVHPGATLALAVGLLCASVLCWFLQYLLPLALAPWHKLSPLTCPSLPSLASSNSKSVLSQTKQGPCNVPPSVFAGRHHPHLVLWQVLK